MKDLQTHYKINFNYYKSFKRAPLKKLFKNASPKKSRFLVSRNSQQSLYNIDLSEKS